MRFYGAFKAAKGLKSAPMIDFMEFEFEKAKREYVPGDLCPDGVTLSCDWDESDWSYDPETGEGFFRCKGVNLNQKPANGCLEMFKRALIDTIQVYSDDKKDPDFELMELVVNDADNQFMMPRRSIKPFATLYSI